jgi:1,4-dihydroxy-6-naphthoate synthase
VNPLTLAYSPCPNDTFICTPWVQGHIPGAPPVVERLDDIDVLNAAALAGEPDIVKVSFHAFGHLRDRYCLLRSGGALGRGCGPLVVAREKDAGSLFTNSEKRLPASFSTVAIPGELTTAALLLRLYAPSLPHAQLVVMRFDEIMPAVRDGRVDAGVIIHEGRFTFQNYGLVQLVDLGEWWEQTTGRAIPLGGIAMRRALGATAIRAVEGAIARSVRFAHAYPDVIWPTIRRHAQEMDDDVMRRHIELYVNAFTYDYGDAGEAAIRHLLDIAESCGIIPRSSESLFGLQSGPPED